MNVEYWPPWSKPNSTRSRITDVTFASFTFGDKKIKIVKVKRKIEH